MWKSIDRIRDVEKVGQRVEAEDCCARTWSQWMKVGWTKKWGKLWSLAKPEGRVSEDKTNPFFGLIKGQK